MSAPQSFHDAVARWKNTPPPPDDTEIDCRECSGTGLTDGPDGAPCVYCDGSGVW